MNQPGVEPSMRSARRQLPPLRLTLAVAAYALAMAYLESAVVVYLRTALDVGVGDVFPLQFAPAGNPLGWIELGRELATLVMIAAVGWLAGRSPLERLAWASVVFGIWDIGYYAWLWVFSGWPPSVTSWDLLFLVPLPWAGPVWAPVAVSAALIGFGLVYAGRLRAGRALQLGIARFAVIVLGGLVVIASFVLNAGVVLAQGTPSAFAWPVFVAGMAIGVAGAVSPLRATAAGPPIPAGVD